jgi:hypothetical protein
MKKTGNEHARIEMSVLHSPSSGRISVSGGGYFCGGI